MRVCTKCSDCKPESEYHHGRPDCKQCRREAARLWREENKELHSARATAWQKANPEKVRQIRKRHHSAHRAQRNAYSLQYQQEHRGKVNAAAMKRYARKLRATPAWANLRYIELFYEFAQAESTRTGRKVHVDHIYPLQSPHVCGLHVEDNLQLLFAEDNKSKGNNMPNLAEAAYHDHCV